MIWIPREVLALGRKPLYIEYKSFHYIPIEDKAQLISILSMLPLHKDILLGPDFEEMNFRLQLMAIVFGAVI